LRKSVQERRQPLRYTPLDFCSSFDLSVSNDDPIIVREVVDSEDSKFQNKSMIEEMTSLDTNEACDLVELPIGRKPVGSKWVFKKKLNAGKVEKYKNRLVAKGYSKVEEIDFGEFFSPVAKLTSIGFLLSIPTTFDLEVEHIDVKKTFLHGDLEEEIYMKQQNVLQ
jgi:hypothetical protein